MGLPSLPIDAFLKDIAASFTHNPCLVLTAATGAGKTTRVPPHFLHDAALDGQKILVLQPRRLAAKATAARMAEELGEPLGETIGYQVRFESAVGKRTRLTVVTEGILERKLVSDPSLAGIGLVVLDEFHERSLHADLCLALLKELQQNLRPDLRILIMSATLQSLPLQNYLGHCPHIDVPGRLYPVDVEHRGAGLRLASSAREIAEGVIESLRADFAHRRPLGDTLVFLPGVGEITRCLELARPLCARLGLEALPLHGSLTLAEQERVLKPAGKMPRLIFSTNIAETSLTLPNVLTVVDSGLARVSVNDPAFGNEKIELRRISKQNAVQRAGRAGRVQAGRCVRLWTRDEHLHLDESLPAEIERVDLAPSLLFLADWGVRDFENFEWFEKPPGPSVRIGREQLQVLGALDADSAITAFGKRLLAWPLNPRFAALLERACELGTPERELADACFLAASLAERPFFGRDFDKARAAHRLGIDPHDSDLVFACALRDRLEGRSEVPEGLHFSALQNALRSQEQLLRTARDRVQRNVPAGRASPLDEALIRAFSDRLAARRGQSADARMVGGRGLSLGAQSLCRAAPLFLACNPFEVREGNRSFARVESAHPVELKHLQAIYPGEVARKRRVTWNEKENKAQAFEALMFRDLPLSEEVPVGVSPAELAELQSRNLFRPFGAFLTRNPRFANFVRRARLLKKHCSEFAPVTEDWSDAGLEAALVAIHDPAACNLTRDELEWLPSVEQLIVGSEALGFFRQNAPHQIDVPSGSVLPLDYPESPDDGPVLRVRLQEIFGWPRSPTVARGRLNVKLELLSPSYKAVQTTQDLESFWRNTYFEVRKELKARYPRHSWPDNPLEAAAVAKGGKKRGSEY